MRRLSLMFLIVLSVALGASSVSAGKPSSRGTKAAPAVLADPTPPPEAPAPPKPEDPYLWLEEVQGEQALDWVRARNTTSQGELQADPGYAPLQERIRSILDSNDRIPYVQKIGEDYYNFWKDADHKRGIWRRVSWTEYQKKAPAWETVLDIDALGAEENESWVWDGADCLPPSSTRCLISLSRGGADASVVREFDLRSGNWVEGGFSLPEAKSAITWIDIDHVFVGTDWGEGSLTSSGYPKEVRRWARGTSLASAEKLFEGEVGDVSVTGWREHTPGFERSWVERGVTFYSTKRYLLQDGQLALLPKPDDSSASTFREWLLLELRSDLQEGGQSYKAGSLLAIRLDAYMRGDRAWELLFEPTARTSLAAAVPTRSHLVLRMLDNVRSRVEVLTPGKKGWTRAPMAGLPELGTVGVSAVDSDRSDEVFVTVTDYVTPTTLSWMRLGKGVPKPIKSLPAFFRAEGLTVTQHTTSSEDGTKIPYFEVSRADLAKDGKAPTLLYGYGGFEVSMLPGYSGTVGAAWLERGGVYVVANIRGGGEFGPAWHQAALKANRPRAYQDFAAVARDLQARQVTDADHLGIMGGSNGGLLMGNMATTYPELFEAVVCSVPLLDMKRFNHLLAGASWMGEYGNPDQPEEWEFIRHFSPYHLLRAEATYPRVLFMTSTRDDRVHPGHARKMAARMLEMGKDILYFENIEGGHGGSADNSQAARQWALAYTFLWRELQ